MTERAFEICQRSTVTIKQNRTNYDCNTVFLSDLILLKISHGSGSLLSSRPIQRNRNCFRIFCDGICTLCGRDRLRSSSRSRLFEHMKAPQDRYRLIPVPGWLNCISFGCIESIQASIFHIDLWETGQRVQLPCTCQEIWKCSHALLYYLCISNIDLRMYLSRSLIWYIRPRGEYEALPALVLCASDDCSLKNIFIDISERNDLKLEISIPGISKLDSLCSNPMCHILSKAFEFSTEITLQIILLSIVSEILFSKIFRISPVDLA